MTAHESAPRADDTAPTVVPSALSTLPLGRSAVPRDAAARTVPGLLEDLRSLPGTRVVEVDGAQVRSGARLTLRRPDDLEHAPGEWFYLGRDDDGAYLGFSHDASPAAPESGTSPGDGWLPLRDIGHTLDDAQTGLATTAVALAAWRTRHRHCPACGAPTHLVEAGWAGRCERDGSLHHPRTDPAVIMAITDPDDRLLLARSAAWPERRRSVLAGFVEAGEGLEQAVVREVEEEVGLAVTGVRYAGAQPWPFPGSLMVAFHGTCEAGTPRPDGVEITAADLVTRDGLAAAVADGSLRLPGRSSIARVLIEQWWGGPIDEPA